MKKNTLTYYSFNTCIYYAHILLADGYSVHYYRSGNSGPAWRS